MSKKSRSKSNNNRKGSKPKTARAKRKEARKTEEKRKQQVAKRQEAKKIREDLFLEQEIEEVEEPVEAVPETVEEPEDTAPAPVAPIGMRPEAEAPSEHRDTWPEYANPDRKEPEHKPAAAPKKKHTGFKVFFITLLLLIYSGLIISGAFYLEKKIVSPDKFHQGTVINGIDVSGMDIDEAKDALTKEWNTHSISIFDEGGSEIGEIKDLGFEYRIDDQLMNVMRPGAEKALLRFRKREGAEFTVKMDPKKTSESFKKQFHDLSIVQNAEGDVPSKNAYIDKSDTEFRIVKEVIGNSVDLTMLRRALFDSISRGEETFQYRRSSFYKAPEIVSTSESLLKERDYCRKYLSFKIRLRNAINDYTITPEWLDKMIKVKSSGKVKVNDDQIDAFIRETLYPKFSSTGGTRHLVSAGGGKYTVTGGTWGFTIDSDKEHDKLKKELKAREDLEREPIYSGKKPGKNWQNDIGQDFVEVSIAKQTVWVVIGGKVKVETPVVTGNVPRHNTPTGVFYIVYKDTNTTLKGHNDDGSEYESHVAYWMPFWLGYGLHDANWRGAFGGSIYIGNGSHGCVNCPPYIMPKIFKLCYTGMPVIVH